MPWRVASRTPSHDLAGCGGCQRRSRTGEAACFGPAITPQAPCTNVIKSTKEDGNTHRLNLTWKITEDHMIYGTWSEGFRPGGINRRGTLPPYLSDYLTNYEFGWKTTWLDNRLSFNGSVFRQDWEDFQFSILGANGLTEIKNANQARINEANLEELKQQALAHFAEVRTLYDQLLKTLAKHGFGSKQYNEVQDAISAQFMLVRFSTRQIESLCESLRSSVNDIRKLEREILDICVSRVRMDRKHFVSQFPGNECNLDWVEREIAAGKPWSDVLSRFKTSSRVSQPLPSRSDQ